jgi:leucyl/phenylalanyl-tRNA---protein transferase
VRYFNGWDTFELPEGAPKDDPVAFCADLSPASVLAAYRRGIIPLPAADEFVRTINEVRYEDEVSTGRIAIVGAPDDDPYRAAWWCPDPRPVMDVGNVHLGRNVAKLLRRADSSGKPLWTTANHAYSKVAEQCRNGREPRWLTDELLATMTELHRDGWAHSIEVWQGNELIGGALGVGIGHILSGDSLFGRGTEIARIAVADLAARFAEHSGQTIDAQWDSPLLRSLGAEPLPRDHYLDTLKADRPTRNPLPTEPLSACRLIEP